MKRASNLLPHITELNNLHLAFWKAGKGKRYKASVRRFQAQLDANLKEIRGQLTTGRIEVGDYHQFHIYDPKKREICAPAFREQVIHHALMNVCHPYFERKQIYDSYASRVGKGTHAALDRAEHFTRQYKYFLKLDVKGFFGSIPHKVMLYQLCKLFREETLLTAFARILDSYQADLGYGLPIGNLTSQYFANHFLSGLDHYIKEQLRVRAYVRYMDDMVFWADSQLQLLDWHASVTEYLQNQLLLQTKPFALASVRQGVPFLGYRILPTHRLLLRRTKLRFRQKIKQLYRDFEAGALTEHDFSCRLMALQQVVLRAETQKFRKKVYLTLPQEKTT